ncbi:MAG: 50S ribosomal protein L32e [Thermoplasmata archaeon]|nr:50S ribosomal protein L32e [Thermoplasmata archaeon]
MADEAPVKADKPAPAREKSPAKKAEAKPKADAAPSAPAASASKSEGPKAPRRPTLDPEARRLLHIRDAQDDARPKFTRQASYRYHRIGRWGNWRTPRGIQSKQRRHYKYRSQVVRIGYGSPAATRGMTPTGFMPVIVHTITEIAKIDPAREAAIIARTVGTKRRLVLEESARKRGVHVLNPIVTDRGEN